MRFDQSEGTQSMELTRQGGRVQFGHERFDVGASHAPDVEFWPLQRAQQRLLGTVEEVQSLHRTLAIVLGLAQPYQVPRPSGEILQRREELQVPAITGSEDLTQVEEAVDGLLQWRYFPGDVAVFVFHLAVMLEKGYVVGGGLQSQHAAELVVHLDPRLAEAVFDAGALDAGGESLLISWASWGVIFLPRKVATCSAFTAKTAWRESCSYKGPSMASERKSKSVAYSTCIRLQW